MIASLRQYHLFDSLRPRFHPVGANLDAQAHPAAWGCTYYWVGDEGRHRYCANKTNASIPSGIAVPDFLYINPSNVTMVGSPFGIVPHFTGAINSLAAGGHGRILAASNTPPNTTAAGCVMVWVYLRAGVLTVGDNPAIYIRAGGPGNNNGINLYLNNETGTMAFTGLVRGAATETVVSGPTNSAVEGRWHQVAMSWVNAGQLNLYVDGQLVASQSSSVSWAYNSQAAYLGAHSLVGGGFFNTWPGMIGPAAYWDRFVHEGEINALYKYPTALISRSELTQSLIAESVLTPSAPVYTLSESLTWDDAYDLDPEVTDELQWSDQFFEGTDPPPFVDADYADTLTWSDTLGEEQYWSDTLQWSGDDTPAFVNLDFFTNTEDTLLWSGGFTVDTNDLAGDRYRR